MTTTTHPTIATTPVELSTWQIDPAHTTAEFAVRHMMVTTVKGYVSRVEGTITFDETDLTRSSVSVTLDTASIETRDPKRDDHLRSADFFDVERFPKIAFASTRIEPEMGGYRIVGDLTMHGVTKEAVLVGAFEGRQRDPWGSERAGFTAQGVIDRREFGLTWNQPLEAAGIMLGNDVRITIEVEAVRQAQLSDATASRSREDKEQSADSVVIATAGANAVLFVVNLATGSSGLRFGIR